LARRRKKRTKQSKSWFGFSRSLKPKKKPARSKSKTIARSDGYRFTFGILAMLVVLAGISVGFLYLEKYVHCLKGASKIGPLELIQPPEWLSSELAERIATVAGGSEFLLVKYTARTVAENLQSLPWLYNLKVQTTGKSLAVNANYRKPLATVSGGGRTWYVAWIGTEDPLFNGNGSIVLLDYLVIDKLPIVEINGFKAKSMPGPGGVWATEDVVSAVKVLLALVEMDKSFTPDKPLLAEIASIDVANFRGRKSLRKPHTILYTRDGTPINWGAAYGESAQYLEASEQEKVAALYKFYADHGTLQGGIVKYIELRYPQKSIPRPPE
jgi:hypothetical protein